MDSQQDEPATNHDSEDEEMEQYFAENEIYAEMEDDEMEGDAELMEINNEENEETGCGWHKNFDASLIRDFEENEENFKLDVFHDITPFEILKKFVNADMINTIIEESQRYVFQRQEQSPTCFRNYKKFDESEFWRFQALILMTGIFRKPEIKDYWETDPLFALQSFPQAMSRDRFMEILQSLHFSDNQENQRNPDRFYKIGTFLPNLIKNFKEVVNVGEFLCIDESLVGFKGRLSFKQYNHMKRRRFGIKIFVLADCQSRVILDILPYQGSSTQLENRTWVNDFGFGGAAVLTLLKDFAGKNHRVVIDNWFMSPSLAKELLETNTYVLGTCQKRRKKMPKCESMKKRLKTGEAVVLCDSKILIERWQDRREVIMLNTFMPHVMNDFFSSNPQNTREKPGSVLVYNKAMGAVDDVDKIIQPYNTLRKSYRWYKKFFFHLMDIAVYNSYMAYQSLKKTKIPYSRYLRILIKEIFDKCPANRPKPGRRPNCMSTTPHIAHVPEKVLSGNGQPRRLQCKQCSKIKIRCLTSYECSICNVRLCVTKRNCFKKFHLNQKNQTCSLNCGVEAQEVSQ